MPAGRIDCVHLLDRGRLLFGSRRTALVAPGEVRGTAPDRELRSALQRLRRTNKVAKTGSYLHSDRRIAGAYTVFITPVLCILINPRDKLISSRSLSSSWPLKSEPASEQALESLKSRPPFGRVTAFATMSLLIAAVCATATFAKESKDLSASAKCSAPAAPKDNAKNHDQWVSSSVLIQAPAAEVWRSIHEERSKDPDLSYSKVLEQISPTEYKLEQKFNFIPIIGSSVCVMSHKEIQNERIDYCLLHSDRFKAMEGSWVLTPYDQGRKTKLELSSRLDLGLPVPRSFMNGVTTKKIQRRLNNVKQMAETNATLTAAKERSAEPKASMVAAKEAHRAD
jgi:hypothetical protein